MSRREKFTPEQVADALKAGGGLYSKAAEHLGAATGGTCAPGTIARYVKTYRRLHRVLGEIAEANLDTAEGKLLDKIKDGDLAAITFYLRTKGRRRGYLPAPAPGSLSGPPTITVTSLRLPDKIEDPEEWAERHGGKVKQH
jgi:hypothetical protein